VESVAIMQYLLARYGPSPLAPTPHEAAFPLYQQFLHLGEAGLAVPANAVFVGRHLAPASEHDVTVTRWALETFNSRLGLVQRQLAKTPYLAGEHFTAADICVTYALEMAERHGTATFGPDIRAYLTRTTQRSGYQRAMNACHATRAWVASQSRSAT
jgi:glutathione S-transferase